VTRVGSIAPGRRKCAVRTLEAMGPSIYSDAHVASYHGVLDIPRVRHCEWRGGGSISAPSKKAMAGCRKHSRCSVMVCGRPVDGRLVNEELTDMGLVLVSGPNHQLALSTCKVQACCLRVHGGLKHETTTGRAQTARSGSEGAKRLSSQVDGNLLPRGPFLALARLCLQLPDPLDES
jgi:hypothetical protein